MNFTIASALRWWVSECPTQIAVSVDDDAVSFAELYAWAGRVGQYLEEQGVKPGDRVSMVSTNSLNYAVLAIALLRIGAIGAPLSFRSTVSELKDWLPDLKPFFVFADPERYSVTADAIGNDSAIRLQPFDVIAQFRTGREAVLAFEPDDNTPAFIIGTSGSTARPKGVVHTHRMVVTYASEFALMEPRCGRGSSVLSVGPFSSSSGYLIMMQMLIQGASVFIESQFRAERALKLLTQHRITTFMGVPTFFERICALEDFAEADLSGLYWTQTAGARVSAELLKAWRDKGVVLRHAYGQTEAGGAWAARDDIAVAEPRKCGRGGMFSEYAIQLEDGNVVRHGGPGEIMIRSACAMNAYWENPQGSAQTIRDGWLHTGDIGEIDATGNLTFIDRLKDIIISGGLNISAAEIERVISELPHVQEVAVISALDNDFGETPLAIVYGDAQHLSAQAIVDHCTRHLAGYKVPRYIAIETDPLPRLPSGKLAKPALRQKFKDAEQYLSKVR